MGQKVSIIILNYNGKQFNIQCIDSILQQNYQDFEIIFVDNLSTDKSLEEVKKTYEEQIVNKKIVIIENKENTWFAWGNNIWHQNSSPESKYICLLNNDTIVPTDWLENLIKWIESDDQLWAVGSIILDAGYEENIKQKIFSEKKIITTSFLWESAWKKIPEDELKKGIYYTSVISGCCFLYKKNLVPNPFPSFYFAYWEDVQLSLFLLAQGYKLAICSESIINHFWSGSFGKEPSEFKLFYGNRNQIINYLTFYNTETTWLLLPLFIISQISHVFVNVPFKRIKAKLQARKWIIKNRKQISKLRMMIKEKKKLSDKKIISTLSYKLSDDIFYGNFSKIKLILIKCINSIFKYYIKLILNVL